MFNWFKKKEDTSCYSLVHERSIEKYNIVVNLSVNNNDPDKYKVLVFIDNVLDTESTFSKSEAKDMFYHIIQCEYDDAKRKEKQLKDINKISREIF